MSLTLKDLRVVKTHGGWDVRFHTASIADIVEVLKSEVATKEFTVKANPTPVLDPYTGEPMQDYPYVEQGILEQTRTTLNPGRYLVFRLDEEGEK